MKKIICYALAFAIVISMLPFTVLATQTEYEGALVLDSTFDHPVRGHETVLVTKHEHYLQFFRYRVHFQVRFTTAEGDVRTYESASFVVNVFNRASKSTIEEVCRYDETMKTLYPHIYQVGLNKTSEKLVKYALKSEELAKELIGNPLLAWRQMETDSVNSGAVMGSISAGAGFNASLQNCLDKGFDFYDTLQDVITQEEELAMENWSINTGDPEYDEAFRKVVIFARKAIVWLGMMWDYGWAILNGISGLEADGSIADFNQAVSPVENDPLYQMVTSQMKEEERVYHDLAYELLFGE